jgi:hypothetical protein
LDVGGGNGRFADRVLSAYPESRGIVIDNARALIDGNTPHPRGRLSVFENMYDGLLIDNLPGRLVYRLTSSRGLAGLCRRLGANTAGVGVCFRSKRQWERRLGESGYRVMAYSDAPGWSTSLPYRIVFHMGRVRFGHFWVA